MFYPEMSLQFIIVFIQISNYEGYFHDIPGLIKEKKIFIGSKFETSSFFDMYNENIFEKLLNAKIQYTSEKNGIFILDSCLSSPISVVINKNVDIFILFLYYII